MQKSGLGIPDFCDWVGTQRIPRAENVRNIADILSDAKAAERFLQDGYDRAIEYLGLAHPDLVSPLFQRTEDVVERLKRPSFYEVEKIRAGKQPGRAPLLHHTISSSGEPKITPFAAGLRVTHDGDAVILN